MTNIAIFASGSGTNAQKIIEHFSNEKCKRVSLVLSNKPDAFVLERAAKAGIKTEIFDRHDFYSSLEVYNRLIAESIDYIVLAGFLWLIPTNILDKYTERIINIHPALLPAFGGKGMYGDRVHRSVLDSGEKESGITIHHVTGSYDEGDIIFQARCSVEPGDTIESLAQRIHKLEHEHYPRIISEQIDKLGQDQ